MYISHDGGFGLAHWTLAALFASISLCCARAEEKGPGKLLTPHFKWAQSSEHLFVSVMVRDLDHASVNVSCSEEELHFRAGNSGGEAYALDLFLREDIKPAATKHEISSKLDSWGTPVVVTLTKLHDHTWDKLVPSPKKYKGLMDKDWSRETGSLALSNDKPYLEDYSPYLIEVTEAKLDKTLAKYDTILANVRFPWCTVCSTQDEAFGRAARIAKKAAKKNAAWKKLAFGVVDAREERAFGRRLDASCKPECRFVALSRGVPPVPVKAQLSEDNWMNDLHRFLTPAVTELSDVSEFEDMKVKTTCLGGFLSKAAPEYIAFKSVAALMRGEITFAAVFGESRAPELWNSGLSAPERYDGAMDAEGQDFEAWLRPRAPMVLLAISWHLHRARFESLGLPIAQFWIDVKDVNQTLTQIGLRIVREVAVGFRGRVLFTRDEAGRSFELTDMGLSAENYPAFTVAWNASYTAPRYEPGVSFTPEFWQQDEAVVKELFQDFLEQVLAGSWPQAHKSAQPQTNWTQGTTKEVVWKTYKEVKDSEKPTLLRLYDHYLSDYERRSLEVDHLAAAVAEFADSFTVARYDLGKNHRPNEITQEKEWFWFPGAGAAPKQLKKPRDPPIKKVVQFLKTQSGLDILDVEEVMGRYEQRLEEKPLPTTTPPPVMPGMDSAKTKSAFSAVEQMGDLLSSAVPDDEDLDFDDAWDASMAGVQEMLGVTGELMREDTDKRAGLKDLYKEALMGENKAKEEKPEL